MFKKIISRILRPRHYWRDIGFDELSELYTSMMFRSLAISLAGIFVPIYLLKLDYSLVEILTFYGLFFTGRVAWDFLAGHLVARFGPKHSIIVANLLQIMAVLMLVTMKDVAWPLFLIAAALGGATSFFFIAFHVDFSKIKHTEHGGKEVSFMNIMDRIGGMFGPLIGGLIATFFGATYMFLAALVLLMVGLIPLFLSGEPVRTHQRLDFRGLPVHKLKADLLSYGALGVENTISLVLWPLFMAMFIFRDQPYASIGIVISVSVIASLFAARAVGKLIDNHRGRALLRYGAAGNAILHLVRPFTTTFRGALGINMGNETVTVAYRLPYLKGMYDAADQLPGYRIVYIVSMEAFASILKATTYWTLCILATVLSSYSVLNSAFVIAAVASCLIMTERFAALDLRVGKK